MDNTRATEDARGWVSTDFSNSTGFWGGTSVNPVNNSSTIFTGSWGGSFTNFTVNWDGSANTSPSGSPRIPICHRVVRRCFRGDFLHRRKLEGMWCQYNGANPQFFRGGKTLTSSCWIRIVPLLNNLWWIIPFLVWVILSGSLANLTCASFAVAVFNSYPTSSIFMFATSLMSLS